MPDLSLRAFARRLGVDEKGIRKAVRSGRLTPAVVGEDGQGRPVILDEAKARAEWTTNASKPRAQSASEASRQVSLERARGLRMANDLRAGMLLHATDVAHAWSRIVVEARNMLLAIPSKLKARRPEVASTTLVELDTLIRASLTGLADGGDRLEDRLEARRHDDQAAHPHPQETP